MGANPKPTTPDSLDVVELVMALEEAFDIQFTARDSEELAREIIDRMARGDFGSDLDDDAIASLVRKLGPRSPRRGGAAVKPEEPLA